MSSVLIIENSSIQLKIISEMLKKQYNVVTARNWDSALTCIKTATPDLVLVSNVLEGLSGYDICKALRQNEKTAVTPIIMMSSMDSPTDISRGFEAGVNGYLIKPFAAEVLFDKLNQICKKTQADNIGKILVIDDSVMVRNLLESGLAKEGFEVYTAVDGVDGLEKAQAIKPNLITTDINMPRMDGYEFCHKLRLIPELADTPLIMITTNDNDESRAKGFEVGVVEYFVKPFDTRVLAEYARDILRSMARKRNRNILIIEDSDTTLHIIKYSLNKHGWNTIAVPSGDNVLELLANNQVDILFLDLYLNSKLTGFDVIQMIRAHREYDALPIIITSSINSKDAVRKGFELGANDYVLKPFDMEEVILRADAHMRIKDLLNQVHDKNEKLIKSEKTRMEFFSFITHELRSPLASIMGFAEMLLEEGASFNDEQKEFLKSIHGAGKQLIDLVSELLDISKIDAGKLELDLEMTAPKDIVTEAVSLMTGMAMNKGLSLAGESEDNLPLINVDSFRIRQVIINLISNSLKFTEQGGVTVFAKLDGNFVKLGVRDTGCGIEADKLEKVFGAYEQVKRSERKSIIRGTGLGLHISRKLCEMHGGKIWVESKVGEGSTFQFTIPIPEESNNTEENKEEQKA